MTESVYSAAKRLGGKSNWSLSHLKMQKLLYLAQMLHLGHHGEPLVSGNFEAWDYGPVHPDLYHRLKIFGSSPVQNVFNSDPSVSENTVIEVLDDVVKFLSNSRPGQLVAITHWSEGAWAKNYVPGARGITIPNEDILEEYRERDQRHVEPAEAAA